MCRRIDCPKCGRPSYAGCGAHIEQVLSDVPAAARCRCREPSAKTERPKVEGEQRSWLRGLLDK